MKQASQCSRTRSLFSVEGHRLPALCGGFTTALHLDQVKMLCILMVHASSSKKGLVFSVSEPSQSPFNAFVGQSISTFIPGVASMTLDPAPVNLVATAGDDGIQFLPQIYIFNGCFCRRLPAACLPAVDPFGDAFAHLFAVQVKRHLARPLERSQGLNHG